MALSMKRRSQLIAANQREYQERYPALIFPEEHELSAATQRRQEILIALDGKVELGCHGTKLDMRQLSPGCRHCVAGGWSCLFINGRCNCDCFYCPTAQDELGLPTTNTVTFRHPADYVAYLDRFGFTGASISGGEPLLSPKRSLAFLAAIKRRFAGTVHTWLYTNGTLLTADLARQLADAGLDEIRFDIGAAGYQLKQLEKAVGLIKVVTVEIPAIPEELTRLKGLVADLRDAGVAHLNLHQLRLTPHNYPRLLPRGYRYLHGEKLTVLDSELAALELIHHAVTQDLGLPVNYCSFVYKNRFQARAARQRNASFVGKGYDALTENGYIRTLTLLGRQERLAELLQKFIDRKVDPRLWSLGRSGERISFHPQLWPLIDPVGLRLLVGYASARQQSSVSYQYPFVNIELNQRMKLTVERCKSIGDIELDEEMAERFGRYFLCGPGGEDALPDTDPWDVITSFERVEEGLQEYY